MKRCNPLKRIAVIYKSAYGSTKQYATWIYEELGADLIEKSNVNSNQLLLYDIIIYGGGLYASGIAGIETITKNICNCRVVFTVGLANPDTTDYSDVLRKNFRSGIPETIRIFHLRGGIDYKDLNLIHKAMMAMLKNFILEKKPEEERTEDECAMLESYGGKIDFSDRPTIMPIVDYVRSLLL